MAKVSIIRCRDYDTDRVFDAVTRAVGLLGGMERFVGPGATVLVKPNLLSARRPEEAVDTHPEVVRAVVRLVKAAGGVPQIGDAPGGYGKNIDEIFDASGMRRIAGEEDVELVRFTAARHVDGIPIARQALECGSFISVPKLKTHSITVLTAALKNTFGAVTGLYKAECHSRAPKEADMVRILAKVHSLVKPRLTVIDGIVGMDGDGPAAGDPKRMDLVMAGVDAVAIDACIAKIVGLQPCDVLLTKTAYEMGLGEADPARIEVVGDALDGFISRDFRLPQTLPLKILPRAVVTALAGLIRFRPWIDGKICTRCELCMKTCPVDAITIAAERCGIDYDKCVRCLCCHEVCPYKAISIKRNILTRMVWG